MKKWLLLIPLALTTMVCAGSPPASASPAQNVADIVAATLTAIAAQSGPATIATVAPSATSTIAPPVASETPTIEPARDFIPPMGTITGKLSYPAEATPPMRLVAFEVSTGEVSYTETVLNQSSYTFDLPVGTYHVVAYSLAAGGFPGGLAGGYTQAVPCGLSVSCTDHSLINVTVTEGVTTPNVDPGDWYAPDGTFPAMPGNYK